MKRFFNSFSLIAAVSMAGLLSACDDTQPTGVAILSSLEPAEMHALAFEADVAFDQVGILSVVETDLSNDPVSFELASLPRATKELPASQRGWRTPFLTPNPRAPDKA